MSEEEVLNVINVNRPNYWGRIFETLYFTADRTIVARTSSQKVGMLFGVVGAGIDTALQQHEDERKRAQYRKSSLDDIVKANKNNYVIPNSDVTAVELSKYYRNTKLVIRTAKNYGKTEWYLGEQWKDVGETNAKLLRPIFKDKLIVGN